MGKDLTVEQTSTWALSLPGSAEACVARHSRTPPGRALLLPRLYFFLKGGSPEQASMLPWTVVHTSLLELSQATAGCWTVAACESQVSRQLGGLAERMWYAFPRFFVKMQCISESDTRAQTPPWPLKNIPVRQCPPLLSITSLQHSGPLCLKFA